MRAQKINSLPKDKNPPNVPNLRPIENFWSYVKQKVYAQGWKPEDLEDLRKRVRKVMSKIGEKVCEKFMTGVSKVRKADKDGAFSNI